jgi:hypothetical protein
MSLALPFRTPTFTIYDTDDPRSHDLAIAVRVLDEFTQATVSTPVRLSLSLKTAGGTFPEEKVVRNLSGGFCFEGQAPGTYQLVVEPDPVRDYYFLHPEPNQPWIDGFSRDVTIPVPGGPGFVVTLAPKPGYPFPPGTTIARGRVVDNAGTGVNLAVVSTNYAQSRPTPQDPDASALVTAETRTDARGFFTLFFRSLHVTPSALQVKASEGGRQDTQTVQVKEREVATVPQLKFP